MLYDDRFAGHQATADPRVVVFGAGACIWPTYPAKRYLVVSDNAVGFFDVLNTTGILIGNNSDLPQHNLIVYFGPLNPLPGWIAVAFKTADADKLGYTWTLALKPPLCVSAGFIEVHFELQKCNVDVPIGNFACPEPSHGSTGDTCRMLQVEWDQDLPPGGWPPE